MSERLPIKWIDENKHIIDAYVLSVRAHHAILRKTQRLRRKDDPAYRARVAARSRAGYAMKRAKRENTTLRLIGCTLAIFRAYLESLFAPGMTWGNYGEWEVDHIKPLTAFDLTKESEVIACFHYSNTQPLWKKDNCAKGCS